MTRIDIDVAKNEYKKYSFALLYLFSEVILSEVEELKDIEWSECIEAKFFNEDEELRLWRESGELVAVRYSGQGDHIDVDYPLDSRFSDKWNEIHIRQYLDYDDDGQAYITGTRIISLGRTV